MTTTLPPAPAKASAPSRREGVRARTAVAGTLVAFVVATLLSADDLDRRAHRLGFGWQRTAAVAVTGPLHDAADAVGLGRPRDLLDRALHNQSSAAHAAAPTTRAVVTRRPTSEQPLRVYLGGDSMSQVFGESFSRLGHDTGVVDTTLEFRFSSGLTRPEYFDWPKRLRALVAGDDRPEVAVVVFGTNDAQRITTPSGTASFGTAKWKAEYAARVGAVMRLLTDAGVDVYWVGLPVMRSDTLTKRVAVLDEIYAAEAAKHPHVTFVDSRPLSVDANGKYAAYLPGDDGAPVRVRAADGVHFTPAGGDRVANEVLGRISERWPLSE